MTVAIFGLLGVIVGGFVTAGVELVLRRRDEQRARRLSVRILSADLLSLAALVEVLLGQAPNGDRPLGALDAHVDVHVDDWRAQRIALTDLDQRDWHAISTVVWSVEHLPDDPSAENLHRLMDAIDQALSMLKAQGP